MQSRETERVWKNAWTRGVADGDSIFVRNGSGDVRAVAQVFEAIVSIHGPSAISSQAFDVRDKSIQRAKIRHQLFDRISASRRIQFRRAGDIQRQKLPAVLDTEYSR